MLAPHTIDTTDRLAGLRDLMAREEHDVQAFVVPSEDQRQFNSRVEYSSDDYIFIQMQANILLPAIRDLLSSQALAVPLVRLRSSR